MKVEKTVELKDGSVTFTGELSPVELDYVLGVGLNFLLSNGALPNTVVEMMPDGETLQ